MNKIIIAQIDTIAGDIEKNADIIISNIKKAKEVNADIIIFPEFALTGYPFGDILSRYPILERQNEALVKIAQETKNLTVVLGCAIEQNISFISVIQNGNILQNNKIFTVNDEVFAIFQSYNSLDYKQKFDTIIHCDCAPSRCSKEYMKNLLLSSLAKKLNVNYIYVNKVGYADNFSFDGASRIYDKTGKLILRAKAFEEDFVITNDLTGKINELPIGMEEKINLDNFDMNYLSDLDRTYKSIVFSIKQYFDKNGFTKAVLGLSGGLDSSVCAVLLADALGCENVWGVSMPSKITSNESKSDAEILAKNLGINFLEVPLSQSIEPTQELLYSAFKKINTEKFYTPTTIENLQARTRATILWSISNEYNKMLPIATSDKSEAYIGYATVNGDMSGGFAPIADVTKTKLFALADFLNKTREQKDVIPQSILEKPPGAELKINPETGKPVYAEEDNMPYEFLDEIIWLIENKKAGRKELLLHKYIYEQNHIITTEQKEEWVNKFYKKSKCAVYKWHIMPSSVVVDIHSINAVEYRHPIISKVF